MKNLCKVVREGAHDLAELYPEVHILVELC